MNKKDYLLLCFFPFIISGCKQVNQAVTKMQVVENLQEDPLIIQLPEWYYRPTGLRPLNIIEMYNYGTSNPDSIKVLPLKNKHGEPVGHEIMDDPENPVMLQMYADPEGRVVEAMVYQVNDTIKKLMVNMR